MDKVYEGVETPPVYLEPYTSYLPQGDDVQGIKEATETVEGQKEEELLDITAMSSNVQSLGGKEESEEVPDFAGGDEEEVVSIEDLMEERDRKNCEICEEEMGIEKEAKEKVNMGGREVWACEECLKEMGHE